MFSEGKIIYSKRFPWIDPAQLLREAVEDVGDGTDSLTFEEFLREVRENSVYVPKPDKLQNRQRFIDLAKQLSLDYGIDMDITEYDHFISANLHLYCGAYTGTLKDMLSGLLNLCDRICFFKLKTEPCDFTLSLDYMTHDRL